MKAKEAADDLLKNICKSDLFSSFKAETNTIQWFNWLDFLDQQTSNQRFGSLNFESDLKHKENKQQESLKSDSKTGNSSTKDSLNSSVRSGNMFGRGLQSSGDKYPALKFPEAMVAIAQAAKDFPGWPLMSNKMQMHKCEKCSQEFCSPLNQRRHMRAIHRRPLNGDKEDLKKKREQIAAFWDKLSSEDANDIVSAKNLSLMDLSVPALVRALSAQLEQPSLLLLPQGYIKVATALLDLVQSKNSKMPIMSGDLFDILEDASERNMLCGVISSSMHRCIFESDPSRVALETKNVAASLGFLVEYKLVRAWIDDKDAEALRCQKALVEEEEAAQKRKAKLLERKKQRKLRLKECKDKERRSTDSSGCLQELKFDVFPREGEDSLTATQSSPSSASSGPDIQSLETPEITNGESENAKCATNSLEGGKTFESVNEAEESVSRSSYHSDSRKQDTLHDSVGERDGESSMRLAFNGMGWKERMQADALYFENHGKQLYGIDRKHYDHQYRGHRLIRASCGGPAYDYFTPRYGHYRERVPSFKRPDVVQGAGHTVWARKTQQTSVALSQHGENGVRNASQGSNDLTAVSVGQSQRSDNSDEFCFARSEKVLCRVSSLSSDSATSQSSVSISAKVGAGDQDSAQNNVISCSSPPHQTVSLKENILMSAALMIGSVSIPLEHPMPDSRKDYSLENSRICGPKFEGKNSLPDCPPSTAAYEQVEEPPLTSTLQSDSKEDSSVIIKNYGSAVQNKSIMKVWRPVTPGDRGALQSGGFPLTESERSNAADTFSEHKDEMDVIARSDHLHGRGSLSASDVSKGVCKDGQQPPDPPSTAHFTELLKFLTQRWSKAMSSPDIVCHCELDDADSDKTV